MNRPTQPKTIALRSAIIEALRLDPDKHKAAASLGITMRYLNMVLNQTPHWTNTKIREQRKAEREQLNTQLTARGLRPGCRTA